MSVHRMQLRGPWEFRWLVGPHPRDGAMLEDEQSSSGRTKMPIGWRESFGEVTGTVELRRRFQKPTNLEAHERVYVVFGGLTGAAKLAVNGTLLGEFTSPGEAPAFDVTSLLLPSNVIAVELRVDGAGVSIAEAGLRGPVVIEIRGEDV